MITRSDIYVKAEHGGETFQEFLKELAAKDVSLQEMLDSMGNKKSETIDDVVARYRKEVGLDVVLSEDESVVKQASVRPMRKLSCRHKQAEHKVIVLLQKDPELMKDVESFCMHSGGHKNNHAILDFLRERLGTEDVSYSDDELVKFIEGLKDKFKQPVHHHHHDPGAIGVQHTDHYEDNSAEFNRG